MSNLKRGIAAMDREMAKLRGTVGERLHQSMTMGVSEDPNYEHCYACGKRGVELMPGIVDIDPGSLLVLVKDAHGHLLCPRCRKASPLISSGSPRRWRRAAVSTNTPPARVSGGTGRRRMKRSPAWATSGRLA